MSYLFQDVGPKAAGQKVCLATTAYDNPDASYTFSIGRSREALSEAGIQTAYFLLAGNCHVDDARNTIIQEFLASDCTDLVFLDADVSWKPRQLVRLCQNDKDLVGGVYPFRRGDKRGDMPVRMLAGAEVKDGLLEVEGLPTGFLRIKRHVLETLVRDVPHFTKNGARVPILFERTFDGVDRWGGDLNFCNRWRATGGKIYADVEMRLGHTAKIILNDSLGAVMRRRAGVTLKHICDKIKAGQETVHDMTEAREYVGNEYGALEDVLMMSVRLVRQATGPIIETGSGLTTVLMAAATKNTVYCLEHHALHAAQLKQLAAEAGVGNIGLCECRMKDRWYDPNDMDGLPEHFSVGLNDGPPRTVGSRMGFYEYFGGRVDTIIVDDADDAAYADELTIWADSENRTITFIEPRAALIHTGNTHEEML